ATTTRVRFDHFIIQMDIDLGTYFSILMILWMAIICTMQVIKNTRCYEHRAHPPLNDKCECAGCFDARFSYLCYLVKRDDDIRFKYFFCGRITRDETSIITILRYCYLNGKYKCARILLGYVRNIEDLSNMVSRFSALRKTKTERMIIRCIATSRISSAQCTDDGADECFR